MTSKTLLHFSRQGLMHALVVWGLLASPLPAQALDEAATKAQMTEDIYRYLLKQEAKKDTGEDVVRLKNGAVLRGTILEEDDEYISFERRGGIKTRIERDKIAAIERGAVEDATVDEETLREKAAEEAAKLMEKLKLPVSLDFQQTRFILIGQFLSRVGGLDVTVSAPLQEARINIAVKETPLFTALTTMAGQAKGRVVGRPNGLVIVPQ